MYINPKTWNPWQGCHKISPGCKKCYMFSEKKRYGQDPDTVVRSKPATFNAPLKWKDPAYVFTCSWSDWFIEEADEWRSEAYDIIHRTPHLTYQILTKRIERARSHWPVLPVFKNTWLGVSVEDRKYGLPRIEILRNTPAALRFLSIEPQLEDIGEINLEGIGWVIVGGESGHDARPFQIDWARSIIRQCKAAGVACFVKQMGSVSMEGALNTGAPGFGGTPDGVIPVQRVFRDKKGGDITEWPVDLRVREFPKVAA